MRNFKLKLVFGDSIKDEECRYLLQNINIQEPINKQKVMDSIEICLMKIRQRLEYEIDVSLRV
jgi:hypothetical protein